MDKTKLLKEYFGEIIETPEEKIFQALISSFFPTKGIMYEVEVSEENLKNGFKEFKKFVGDLPEQLRIVKFV